MADAIRSLADPPPRPADYEGCVQAVMAPMRVLVWDPAKGRSYKAWAIAWDISRHHMRRISAEAWRRVNAEQTSTERAVLAGEAARYVSDLLRCGSREARRPAPDGKVLAAAERCATALLSAKTATAGPTAGVRVIVEETPPDDDEGA